MIQPTEKPRVVAVIEDSEVWQNIYRNLHDARTEIHVFGTHPEAAEWLASHKADMVISDNRIAGQSFTGCEWVQQFREDDTHTPVIVASTHMGGVEKARALAAGAQDIISKMDSTSATLRALIDEWAGKDVALQQGVSKGGISR